LAPAVGTIIAVTFELRVVSWNLQHTLQRARARVALLRDLEERLGGWDVLCAQEVMSEMLGLIREAFEGEVAYSFGEGGDREAGARSAAAILVRAPWTMVDGKPLRQAPSPLRTATATLQREGRRQVAIASGALPPASMARWGVDAKVGQSHAFQRWMAQHSTLPVVIGLDANGPLIDAVDDVVFHDQRERVLFGFEGAPLVDSYRAHLDDLDLAHVRRLRPEGPLAVTHMAGGKAPRRYDYILAKGRAVLDAGYIVADAFAAGSDHALAYATLQLPA
jgi:endonuclease/exonuclease/phosphatase family metal-dependent hydrolase